MATMKLFFLAIYLFGATFCFAWGLNNFRIDWPSKEKKEKPLEALPPIEEDINPPKALFSKSVARNTYCHRARLEFAKLCSLHTPEHRMKLSSYVANCHLEGMGKKGYAWDPDAKLENAGAGYVSLVMQFSIRIDSICDMAGYSPAMALIHDQMNSEEDMRTNLDELFRITTRLEAANKESEKFSQNVRDISVGRIEYMSNLSSILLQATTGFELHHNKLVKEHEKRLYDFEKMSKDTFDHFLEVDGVFGNVSQHMKRLEDLIILHIAHLEEEAKNRSELFLPLFNNIYDINQSLTVSNTLQAEAAKKKNRFFQFFNGYHLESIKRIAYVKDMVLAPLELSAKLKVLEGNRFVGPYAKDLLSSIHFFLILLSFYLGYKVTIILLHVLEAAVRLGNMFSPLQGLLFAIRNIFFSPYTQTTWHTNVKGEGMRLSEKALNDLVSTSISDSLTEFIKKTNSNNTSQDNATLMLILAKLSSLEVNVLQASHGVRLIQDKLVLLEALREERSSERKNERRRSSKASRPVGTGAKRQLDLSLCSDEESRKDDEGDSAFSDTDSPDSSMTSTSLTEKGQRKRSSSTPAKARNTPSRSVKSRRSTRRK